MVTTTGPLADCHPIFTVKIGDDPVSDPVQITVDTTPPTVSKVVVDADGDGFDDYLEITGNDALPGAGVGEIRYSFDGGPETVVAATGPSFTAVVPLPHSPNVSITFYSVDKASNESQHITQSHAVDYCPADAGACQRLRIGWWPCWRSLRNRTTRTGHRR